MKDEYRITSSLDELEGWRPEGERVSVGFRPSGELHVGNLLSISYAAVLADRLDKSLDLMVCDTDWSAHIHENHRPENNRVMKLFFERDCPCSEHENIAEHRLDEIMPFIDGLEEELGIEVEKNFLSDLDDDEYLDALRTILENMDEFDSIFGGGFRRRYRSPVTNTCDCGFSHAKGAAYSKRGDEVVAACRNHDCEKGFASSRLDEDIGVYYLVDPVRDPGRNVAVHVFGGDYREAEKEQKTSKIVKVAKITELATGETPAYFLGPMIADENGKPLSKSKGTGRTVSEIEDLEGYGRKMAGKVSDWIEEERRFLPESDL